MKEPNISEHFERYYFHELEVKEKLTNRVQMSFALLVGEYTVLSYMLRTVDYSQDIRVLVLFGISIILTIWFSGISVKHLLKAFHGNEYSGIPSPTETEEYRQKLIRHKAEIEEYNQANPNNRQPITDVAEQLDSYLYGKYEKCCSKNIEVNSSRMDFIHDAIKWLLRSAIPLVASCLIFIVVDLDSASPRKSAEINDKQVADAILLLNSTLKTIQPKKEIEPCMMIKTHHLHRHPCRNNQETELLSKMKSHQQEKMMKDEDQKPPPPPPPPPSEPEARLIKDGSDKSKS